MTQPSIDLLLAATPRSGSTVLCAMMTQGRQRMFHEPRVYTTGSWGSIADWQSKNPKSKTGVKEILPIECELASRNARQTILMVRNPLHVLRSMVEKMEKQGVGEHDQGPCTLVEASFRFMASVSDQYPVIRYENWVRDDGYRAIEILTGWRVSPHLCKNALKVSRNKSGREYEFEKHVKTGLSDRSVVQRESEMFQTLPAWAHSVLHGESYFRYARAFGYLTM